MLKKKYDLAYEKGTPIISDKEYDKLFNKDFSIGYSDDKNTVNKLPILLSSLDKITDINKLIKWINKTDDSLIIITPKLDGIALLYDIEKNNLFTRGNGSYGRIVNKYLDFKKQYKNILSCLDNDVKYIRGEIIMDKKIFNRKYKKSFSNVRNMIAGYFNKINPSKDFGKDLVFIPYEFIYKNTKSHQQKSFYEQFNQINKEININIKSFKDIIIPYISKEKNEINETFINKCFDLFKNKYNYDIDGLVLSYNNYIKENSIKNPKYSIGFKINTVINKDSKETEVIDITWNLSRWGLYHPIINVVPIKVSNVTISKVSGHNENYIKDNKLGKGSKVTILRSGDVIPKIVKIIKESKIISIPPKIDYSSDEINKKIIIDICYKLKFKFVGSKIINIFFYNNIKDFYTILTISKTKLKEILTEKIFINFVNERNKILSTTYQDYELYTIFGVFGNNARNIKLILSSVNLYKKITIEDLTNIKGISIKSANNIIKNIGFMKLVYSKYKKILNIKKSI